MKINLIAAVGKNLELGLHNHLIWNIQEDLEFFKTKTIGKTIVMGRKTFESLPGLLLERKMVVLSKNKKDFPKQVIVYQSLDELLKHLQESEIFVIGGAQIYQLFLEYATKIYLTEIDAENVADTFFPVFDKTKWKRTVLSEYQYPIPYRHVEYVKKR